MQDPVPTCPVKAQGMTRGEDSGNTRGDHAYLDTVERATNYPQMILNFCTRNGFTGRNKTLTNRVLRGVQ